MASVEQITDLAERLSYETLYTQSEREQILKLNQEVSNNTTQVFRAAWLVRQQKSVFLSLATEEASQCCLKANLIEATNFVDAFQHLNYHESKFSQLLRELKDDNDMMSGFLCFLSLNSNHNSSERLSLLESCISSIYGSCICADDELQVTKLLKILAEKLLEQPGNQPLQILTRTNSLWCQLYRLFCDSVYSFKIFLSASLSQPVIHLLTKDDWFLDIEPDKVPERFPPQRKVERFGTPGTEGYSRKTQQYRLKIVNVLKEYTEDFILHIRQAVQACLPYPLRWLLSHIRILLAGKYLSEVAARRVCMELLFDQFICPAIIDPLLYGLTSEVTVSHLARHNLMQIARILQVLSRNDSAEMQRFPDIYSMFDDNCLTSIVNDMLISTPSAELELSVADNLTRGVVFVGTQQLGHMIVLLREYCAQLEAESSSSSKLNQLVSALPSLPILELWPKATQEGQDKSIGTPITTANLSPSLKSRGSRATLVITPESKQAKKRAILKEKQRVNSLDNSPAGMIGIPSASTGNLPTFTAQDVMVITIADTDMVGMLEEEKVMKQIEVEESRNDQTSRIDGSIKRTRFVLEHDQESLTNNFDFPASEYQASEYQASELADAISEAVSVASMRSERSTNLDENDDVDDNLSDMVSANVSGRGSPNLSGRDTPQSNGAFDSQQPQPASTTLRSLPVTVQKPDGGDLVDRFNKFELSVERNGASGDVRSVLSDGWSVDAYPDSETAESTNEADSVLVQINAATNEGAAVPPGARFPPDQANETQSESAWSTDVLNSDTSERPSDRIRELDMNSIAESIDQGNESDGMSVRSTDSRRGEAPNSPFVPLSRTRSGGQLVPNQHTPAFQPFSLNTPPTGLPGINQLNHSSNSQFTFSEESSPDSRPNLANQLLQPTVLPPNIHSAPQTSADSVLDLFDPLSQTGSQTTPRHPGIAPGSAPAGQHDPWIAGNENRSEDNWRNVDVTARPPTWANHNSDGMRNTVTPASRRWAIVEEGERPATWASPAVSAANQGAAGGAATAVQPMVSNVMVASQGAIPKQSTRSRNGSGDMDNEPVIQPGRKLGKEKKSSNFSSFFGGRKSGKKGGSGKNSPARLSDRISSPYQSGVLDRSSDLGSTPSISGGSDSLPVIDSVPEDLLEKFRTKPEDVATPPHTEAPPSPMSEPEEEMEPIYDPNNLEKCPAFLTSKKKLRLFLSTPELISVAVQSRYPLFQPSYQERHQSNPLIPFVKSLYAEALLHGNIQLITQLQETLRGLEYFDDIGCRKLLRAVKQEYQSRAGYVTYLVRSHQQLLSMNRRLLSMLSAFGTENDCCSESLISECVRIYMQKKEQYLGVMVNAFNKLQAVDEKLEEVEKCINLCFNDMIHDNMWTCSNENMRLSAQLHIERAVMAYVYAPMMYPLGDVDKQRDKIFTENISRLATNLSPKHKKLRIPSSYLAEAPWRSAQDILLRINAFKTPREKVQCVSQCANAIIGLLKLAYNKTAPGADDQLPVLIFVLIKSNPPYLLSTLNYVDTFYRPRMEGEEEYNWNQLEAAVRYIKMWISCELQSSRQPDTNHSTHL